MQTIILRVDGTSIQLELSERAMRQVDKDYKILLEARIAASSTEQELEEQEQELKAHAQVFRSAVIRTTMSFIEHIVLSNTAVRDLVRGHLEPSNLDYQWKLANAP
jgi:hypothetical protein